MLYTEVEQIPNLMGFLFRNLSYFWCEWGVAFLNNLLHEVQVVWLNLRFSPEGVQQAV